ncbi:hypothetical protein ACFVFI_36835 [Streptomyces sp. NPDC057705]|uniref:hypothetical protein n=1 Tax=Streptomyces sp. NPDC057705 TaxID=3346222 RepID=UPI00367DE5DA
MDQAVAAVTAAAVTAAANTPGGDCRSRTCTRGRRRGTGEGRAGRAHGCGR